MTTDIQSTDLDFTQIKESLKTFFEGKSQYADYNFEGAALNNLLDVLAWNTHYNALVANMAINESFLETAQLRSAVVTHAQSLGYFPKSKTASQVTVQITTNLSSFVGNPPDTITLPAGTKFNAVVDGVTYVFQTRQAYMATNDGLGSYSFIDEAGSRNLKLYEGEEIIKTFFVPAADTQPIYVIPDDSMDTETVLVKVFENQNSSNFVTYTDLKDAIRITSTSQYYLMREAPNQNYELQFGSADALGTTPIAGNKIEVNYLRVNGSEANGARIFTPQTRITVSSQNFSLSVIAQERSRGGSDRESINSIRTSAPLNYASQRRAVTKQDYEALITANNSSISAVAAWGGEENDPVNYGKIYLSLIYTDEDLDSDSKLIVQADITDNIIAPLATMSIDPVFITPQTIDLALTVEYDINPNKTSLTTQWITNQIHSKIQEYFTNNLKTFDGVFRRSALIEQIDNLNDAILSTSITVQTVNTFTPTLGLNKSYRIDFTEQIAEPDKDTYTVTSDIFVVDNQNVRIRNRLGTAILELVNAAGTTVIQRNIGSYSPNSGRVIIDSLTVQNLLSGNTEIKIITVPRNQRVIRPIRNYIIDLDDDLIVIAPNVDFETTRVSL
jgi:hypothetical protein